MVNDGIYTVKDYITSRKSLIDKIKAIDSLIEQFEFSLIETGESVNYGSYELNDGQMRVSTTYRSPRDVMDGILGLEQLKNRYLSKLNGRTRVFKSGNF